MKFVSYAENNATHLWNTLNKICFKCKSRTQSSKLLFSNFSPQHVYIGANLANKINQNFLLSSSKKFNRVN